MLLHVDYGYVLTYVQLTVMYTILALSVNYHCLMSDASVVVGDHDAG